MADRKSFLLRLEAKLLAELKRVAAAELRSVNSQIEFMLRKAMSERGRGTSDGDE